MIRIHCLHPKAIIPPGIAYKSRSGDGSLALNEHPDDGPWIECSDITDFDEDAHVPGDLTSVEVMAVLRALAERYPEHVVVAADEVRSRLGEPGVNAWRHPDDVEAIEQAWERGMEHYGLAQFEGFENPSLAAELMLANLRDRISDQRREELADGHEWREQAESLLVQRASESGGAK